MISAERRTSSWRRPPTAAAAVELFGLPGWVAAELAMLDRVHVLKAGKEPPAVVAELIALRTAHRAAWAPRPAHRRRALCTTRWPGRVPRLLEHQAEHRKLAAGLTGSALSSRGRHDRAAPAPRCWRVAASAAACDLPSPPGADPHLLAHRHVDVRPRVPGRTAGRAPSARTGCAGRCRRCRRCGVHPSGAGLTSVQITPTARRRLASRGTATATVAVAVGRGWRLRPGWPRPNRSPSPSPGCVGGSYHPQRRLLHDLADRLDSRFRRGRSGALPIGQAVQLPATPAPSRQPAPPH